MTAEELSNRLQLALDQHQAGRLEEAEAGYRAVLAQQPEHPDALHLLGVLLDARGHPGEAHDLILRAIAASPDNGVFQLNLGNVLRRLGRHEDALTAWRSAAALSRDLAAAAYANVAALSAELGRPQDVVAARQRLARAYAAVETAEAARAASPSGGAHIASSVAALEELAAACDAAGESKSAVDAAAAAAALAPQDGSVLNNLGRLLTRCGRINEAIGVYRVALKLLPDEPAILINLASAIGTSGARVLNEAIAAARRAIEVAPNFGGAYEALSTLLRESGRPAEAATAARQAVTLNPQSGPAYDALGNALFDLGLPDEAADASRRVMQLEPGRFESHSNLLMTMHYAREASAAAIHAEHLRWGERHANRLTRAAATPHLNDRSPDRPLRIGYVSPDFRRHPVAFFFAPLLQHHARGPGGGFEVVLYSNTRQHDEVSARFRSQCDAWREIAGMSDEAVARSIREDRIDILVDLAGHTANNRLRVFAHKPAPVQATYIGYWNTTGMTAINYRLSDAWNDPAGGPTEQWWVEKLARVRGGAWCFGAPTVRPDVSPSPAEQNGFVTFISTNKAVKVSDAYLRLWRRILEESGRARLLIVTGGTEGRVRDAFRGIDRSRYELLDRRPLDEYFRLYGRADVLLDVGPHNGHTTSVDALWQGLPVLTVAGDMHCSRLTTSLLAAAGLEQFACASPAQYVDQALGLEQRIDELAGLRRTMRDRLLVSPLTDGARLAREIELKFREMWRAWCESPASP